MESSALCIHVGPTVSLLLLFSGYLHKKCFKGTDTVGTYNHRECYHKNILVIFEQAAVYYLSLCLKLFQVAKIERFGISNWC